MRVWLSFGLMLATSLLQGCGPVKTGGAGGNGAGTPQATSVDALGAETYREDQKIENAAIDRIYEKYRILIHVNVTSFKRSVLISGEVPDEATKGAIEKIVAGIEGVRHLNNELVVSGNISLASRSNDSLITTSVKLRLVRDNRVSAEHVRVVTENGTVFLLGSVKRAEGDAAAELASTTGKVVRVVKLFEYTD